MIIYPSLDFFLFDIFLGMTRDFSTGFALLQVILEPVIFSVLQPRRPRRLRSSGLLRSVAWSVDKGRRSLRISAHFPATHEFDAGLMVVLWWLTVIQWWLMVIWWWFTRPGLHVPKTMEHMILMGFVYGDCLVKSFGPWHEILSVMGIWMGHHIR